MVLKQTLINSSFLPQGETYATQDVSSPRPNGQVEKDGDKAILVDWDDEKGEFTLVTSSQNGKEKRKSRNEGVLITVLLFLRTLRTQ